ncbi:MAG TPA: response regulator [Actinomycetota bacterium]|nr:response regulator [Actinomycetota bacterium]
MARIHIVDDDADIRQLVTYWLIEEGHEVSAAPDGEATLEKLIADPPDLLILDIMMPKVDGYTVLKNLAAYGASDSTKILILSAKSSEQDRELGLQLGADQYMNKPFEPEELVATVREILTLSKEQLRERREEERDKARLLSQLESFFGE